MSKSTSRRLFLKSHIAALTFSALAGPAFAKTIQRFYQNGNTGVVLKGYDTTAYFNHDAATAGNNGHEVRWKGANWHFANSGDAEQFRKNPDKYAPQFGAYCTRAMSLGKEVPGNPKVWRIHNGKLYVFYASKGGTYFDKGPDEMITRAQQHWDTLQFTE